MTKPLTAPGTFFANWDPNEVLEDLAPDTHETPPEPDTHETPPEPEPEMMGSDINATFDALAGKSTGLVRALQDYFDACAVRRNPTLDFAVAIAATGALSQRGFFVEFQGQVTAPAVLINVLAESATGKENVVQMANKVGAAASMGRGETNPAFLVKNGYSSSQIFHEELARCPVHLIIKDESSRKDKNAAVGGDTHASNVDTALTEWYPRFAGKIAADPKRDKKLSLPAVYHPLITGVFLAQPESFKESLTKSALDEGVVSRRITLQVVGLPDRIKRTGPPAQMPSEIREAIERLTSAAMKGLPNNAAGDLTPSDRAKLESQLGIQKLSVIEGADEPGSHWMRAIKPRSEAVAEQLWDAVIGMDDAARASQSLAGRRLFSRAGEAVVRLCGLFALSDAALDASHNLQRVLIEQHHIDFATAVVRISIELIAPDVEENTAAGHIDAVRKRLLNAVDKVIAEGGHDVFDINGVKYARSSAVKRRAKNGRDATSKLVSEEMTGLIEDCILEEESAGQAKNGATIFIVRRAV